MEFDVYHDESREDGHWHGILLVPRKSRHLLLTVLAATRYLSRYNSSLTLKGLRNRKKRFECTRTWINAGVFSLLQNPKNKPLPKIYYRDWFYSEVDRRMASDYIHLALSEPIGAKFILFREASSHKSMDVYSYTDHGAKEETTFRIGFKGGLHYLFNEESPAHINSIHFHCYEHHKRAPDRDRIIGRLRNGLREYCTLALDVPIDYRSGDHTKRNCQAYDDCQFLQLTDLLTGAFRIAICGAKPLQKEASGDVGALINKWKQGKVRMRNSRWYRGFCITDSYIDDIGWHFNNHITSTDLTCGQMKLNI